MSALALLLCIAPSVHAQQNKHDNKPIATTFEPQFPALNDNYPPTADSIEHPGIPKGTQFRFQLSDSHIYPAVSHLITVYVPAEYKADRPACVFVFFDNIGFSAPVVFDNLIAAHQMPVTIAIGIQPAYEPSVTDPKVRRYDRSMEFDTTSDRLARFVIDEVLPAVQSHKAPGGLPLLLSADPNDRAIAGNSTGGIAALNVAWQRPDAFRRVFTNIGTFVGMRGGEDFYVRVRKTEPKPIRVFMVDGANDGWGGGLEMGDWWMGNLTMERALTYAGYDVNHAWGAGNHNGNLAEQVFPQAVRWLFRDYPSPIVAQPPNSQALKPILIEGEPWKPIPAACPDAAPLAAAQDGALYTAGVLLAQSASCNIHSQLRSFALAADGTSYSADDTKPGILVQKPGAPDQLLALDLDITALTLRSDGTLFVASAPAAAGAPAALYRIPPEAKPLKLAETPHAVSALALTPDGNWLFAAQPDSHLSFNFRVAPDGTLDAGEPFYDLDTPADVDGSGARAVAFDREGRAYVATALGVQVMDHNGRVMAILPLPNAAAADAVAFGGPDFMTLYVHAGGIVYARRLKIGGLFPASRPVPVPDWGSG